jgi:hypothetical protein
MAAVNVSVDTSILARQCRELKSLCLEARSVPENILFDIRNLLRELRSEVAFERAATVSGACDQVLMMSFKKGGKFEACVSALRALPLRGEE